MSKRKEERLKKKLIVSFVNEGFDTLGLTEDISKCGLCINSNQKVPEHQEIIVSIAVPGDVIELKGEVMWCKESDDKDDTIPDSIGIKITEAPPDYLNYIEYIGQQRSKQGKPEI